MNPLKNPNPFLPILLLFLSTVPPRLNAQNEICKTTLPELAKGTQSLTATADPYAYPTYKGPKNAILQAVLETPAPERNPRFANIGQHGKVYSWEEVFSAVGLNMEGRPDPHKIQVFVNAEDPMTHVTQRGPFVKDAYSIWEPKVADWILQQYPELREPVKQWEEANFDKDRRVHEIIKKQTFDQWMKEHPEYKNGLLIFPRPTLWNKVGDRKRVLTNQGDYESSRPYSDAIGAGREYDIKTIASLFDPKLAEENFDDLRGMLVHLAGPHVSRLSQPGTIDTIARWVLTQYPELRALVDNPKLSKDPDFLGGHFGETLGVIPVEWATGDLRSIHASEMNPMAADWKKETLPRIVNYIRGDIAPNQAPVKFTLIDPETKQRREIRVGDEVELAYRPSGPLHGNLTYLDQHGFRGLVTNLVKDNGNLVGFKLDGTAYLDTKVKDQLFLFSDFDQRDSRLLKAGHGEEKAIELSDIKSPEDSGEVTLRFGKSGLQAPISKGDGISLHTKLPNEPYGNFVDMIVTGFERDKEGRVTALQGYTDSGHDGFKTWVFDHAKGIERAPDGTPLSILTRDGEKRPLAENFSLKTIPLQYVQRMDDTTGFNGGAYKYFEPPQSLKRSPYDHSLSWYASKSTGVGAYQDSGDYMLRIGSPSFFGDGNRKVEQVPLSPGDEVLLHVKTPGTLLGFRYDRVLISSIVFENGKAVGIRGTNIGASTENTWLFKDIRSEDSHLETRPWFGQRAHSIPGAFEKRKPYTEKAKSRFDFFTSFFRGSKKQPGGAPPGEDLFGYHYVNPNEKIETPAWQDKPGKFDDWLEENKLANHHEYKPSWAYWVLQIEPDSTFEKAQAQYRALAMRFHPDKTAGDDSAMKIVNEAWETIEAFKRR